MSIGAVVDKGITVSQYIAQNTQAIQWSVDLRALGVDLLFWMNSSILIALLSEAIVKIVKTRLRPYNKDATTL